MTRRHSICRIASLTACLALAGTLAGCSSANNVAFTNVSESWVSVRFFVGTGHGSTELASKKQFQIRPGETVKFSVPSRTYSSGEPRLVHMKVQAVTPSWDPPGHQYWMELLTDGSIKIVARGKGKKLEFETGDGEVARIPNRQLKKRFDYRVAGAPIDVDP